MDSTTTSPPAQSSGRKVPAWIIYSLLTILFWGLWSTLTKIISSDISAYMNQVLFSIGLLPVLVVILRSRRLAGGRNRKRGMFYAFATGVLGGVGNIAFFQALAVGGKASVVVPATSLSPLVTVVIGYIGLKEKTNATQKAGLMLALLAIYLLSLE